MEDCDRHIWIMQIEGYPELNIKARTSKEALRKYIKKTMGSALGIVKLEKAV